jgi:hypothetical protein
LILHLVFRTLGDAAVNEEPERDAIDNIKYDITDITNEILRKTQQAASQLYPETYVGELFKNRTKCRAVVEGVLSGLPDPQQSLFSEDDWNVI